MDAQNKKKIITYSVLSASLLLFVASIFGLSFFVDSMKANSYMPALQKFFTENNNIPEKYRNIRIQSLSEPSREFTGSFSKNLATLSTESFFLTHTSGTALIFIEPVFTNAGPANALFFCEDIKAPVEFLGLLDSGNYKISKAEIFYATKKIQSLLEAVAP